MATYKLIQDIEAEDHILGPLTFRQFLYGLVAAFFYYLSFVVFVKGAAFLLVIMLPPALFCTFFAFPFGKDQSTEVWALAKLRFLFKPRRRIWDQSGMKELVTITAPKKIEIVRTNGLSQLEVNSRLSALANTLDSRGWAVKNVNVSSYVQPDPFMAEPTDRLIDVSALPQEVPNYDVTASDDIMDSSSNPIAQQFESMITAAEQAHRQQLMNQLNSPATAQAYPAAATPTASEQALLQRLKAQQQSSEMPWSHLRTLRPPSQSVPATPVDDQAARPPQAQAVTPQADPAILSLASNNDLNVATLGREARRAKHEGDADGEVVISLH